MPGARHLRGTVASRVRNLLRGGAITKAWKPLWFPVVEAFPPLVDTKVNRRAEAGRMQKIIYPEDRFRKQFYERFQTKQPVYLWGGQRSSHCDRFVNTCMQLVQEGMNDEEAIEKAANTLEFNQMFARRGEETEHDDWSDGMILNVPYKDADDKFDFPAVDDMLVGDSDYSDMP